MLLLTGIALAQTSNPLVPPIDAQRFRPSVDARFTLWTDDAGRGQSLRPSFRVLAHYAHEPLIYNFADGGDTAVVGNLLQTDLIGGFSYERFRLGVVLPIYLLATSEVLGSQTGIGDAQVDAKATVLDGDDAPVRVAVAARVGFPTTSLSNALGARRVTWEFTGILDRSFGDAQIGINLGIRGGPEAQLENVKLNDFAVVRVGGGYQFTDTFGGGAEIVADVPLQPDAANALAAEWMVNLRARLSSSLTLRIGGGTGLTEGIATPDWRALVGLVMQAEGPRDTDGDGIADAVDACKDEPEDLDGEDDLDGCPDDVGSLVVQVFDPTGAAVLDATIRVGPSEGIGALQARIPGGVYTVTAEAPGHLPASVDLTLLDADENRPVVLVLQPGPVPIDVSVSGPDGVLTDAQVVIDGGAVPTEVLPGVVVLTATAPGFVSQNRIVEVVPGVPVEVAFQMRPVRVPFLVADDGTEGHVDFGASTTLAPGATEILDTAAQLLQEVDGARLQLLGHRTETEPPELARQRAEAVRDALIVRGVPGERLVIADASDAGSPRVELLLLRSSR